MSNPILVLFAVISLYGCAYSQSVSLIDESEIIPDTHNIKIVDNRSKESKETILDSYPNCSRRYGDKFISPSKIEYLKHELIKVYNKATLLKLEIDVFDTIEYCNYSTAKAIGIATSAAASSALSASYPGSNYYTHTSQHQTIWVEIILS